MKSKILLILLICKLAFTPNLSSQNIGINTTGSLPDTSAMLDIVSSTKGLLIPRVTTAQRNSITLPANGLIIYNTTTNTLQYNTGTSATPYWKDEANQWSINGNTGINTSSNYLGTSDNNEVILKVNNGIKAVAPKSTTIGLLSGDTNSIKNYLASPSAAITGGFATLNSNHTIFNLSATGTTAYGWDGAAASGTAAAPGLPAANALISKTNGLMYDGAAFVNSASMRLYADGTPTGSSLPSKISLWTTPSGSKTESERVTINNAGSVGINNTSPNANAVLDIASTNKGMLPPRLSLTSTTSASPLAAHVQGMIVYNTANVNDVVTGIYVNDGSRWAKLSTKDYSGSLAVGESYTYSATIPYNTWTSFHYLDEYVTPVVSTVPALPVIEGLTITAQLALGNWLYRPLFRNVSGSPKTFTFNSLATNNSYDAGTNLTLANNTYIGTYDDVYLNVSNNETSQINLIINNKWYRVVYFPTLDAASVSGNYTVRIYVTRLL
jgi:hypothetical protein